MPTASLLQRWLWICDEYCRMSCRISCRISGLMATKFKWRCRTCKAVLADGHATVGHARRGSTAKQTRNECCSASFHGRWLVSWRPERFICGQRRTTSAQESWNLGEWNRCTKPAQNMQKSTCSPQPISTGCCWFSNRWCNRQQLQTRPFQLTRRASKRPRFRVLPERPQEQNGEWQ